MLPKVHDAPWLHRRCSTSTVHILELLFTAPNTLLLSMHVDRLVVEKALGIADHAEEGRCWQDLSRACELGDVHTLHQVCEQGADIRYQEPVKGKSALMIAASSGHVGAVRFLLENGAPWNAQDRDHLSAGELSSAHPEARLLFCCMLIF